MSKFKIGDKVRCIKKPPESSYQCKVGDTATIRKTINMIVWFNELICTDYPDDKTQCFNEKLFEFIPNTLDIERIYDEQV